MMAAYYAPLVGFESRKAAQISAYFADKEGGSIEKLKLIKLIYLAEREFVKRHGLPMLYDEFFSLKDGPVCSSTLNGINGSIDKDTWDDFISRRGRYVSPTMKITRDKLDEISKAELAVLDATWQSFGWMTASQIRNYAHKNCPEYVETTGRIPISYKDMLVAQGDEDAIEIQDNIDQSRRVKSILR